MSVPPAATPPSAAAAAQTIAQLTLEALNDALQTLPERHAEASALACAPPLLTSLTTRVSDNLSLLTAYLTSVLPSSAPPPPPPPPPAADALDARIARLRGAVRRLRGERRTQLRARLAAVRQLNDSLSALRDAQSQSLDAAVRAGTRADVHPARTRRQLSAATEARSDTLADDADNNNNNNNNNNNIIIDSHMAAAAAAAAHRLTRSHRLAAQMMPDHARALLAPAAPADATVPSAAHVFDVVNSPHARQQHHRHLHQLQAHLLGRSQS